ncbi:MAG: hypothetical protein EXS09_14205 [Gemmataceae bacterium]|nr:hypothetical protein [Gemmataceae bacterium]
MTRIETTIVACAAFFVGLVQSPVFAQNVTFDGPGGKTIVKQVPADVTGKPSKKKEKKELPATAQTAKEPTFTATGGFESTIDKARESAVRVAVEKLHGHMKQQYPSLHRQPTTELVQRMLIADQEKVTEEPIDSETGKKETMYRMTVAVHVDEKQVRELRSRERSSEALWVLGGLGGLAGVLAIFFRIDVWTKGYLTSWVVLGTVGAGALLAGLWWMAK